MGHGVKYGHVQDLNPSSRMCFVCGRRRPGSAVAAHNPNRSVILVAGAPYLRPCLNSFTNFFFTTHDVRRTKPRLLIEIVSENPYWLFMERTDGEACVRLCVQWDSVQSVLWLLLCLLMKHLCTFVDRLQMRALGAYMS